MLVRDIAEVLSARVIGDDSIDVDQLVHPAEAASASDLALAMTEETLAALAVTKAQAIVVSANRDLPAQRFRAVIVAGEERAALATITRLFDTGPAYTPGIHHAAIVASDAVIGEDVSIGPLSIIGARSRIGARTVILPHTMIGADVIIGADGLIHSGACIGDRVVIGDRALIHFNVSIGADGFSFAPQPDRRQRKVYSLGHVAIGDDVEIGAATTIDRATLQATRIGNGTKIDNHVHIAHNVRIGENCLICGMVGISGSVAIGDRVIIGGGAGISDQIRIGSGARVAAGSGVGTNVPPGVTVSGYPAMRHDRTLQALGYLARQKALHNNVAELGTRVNALEQAGKLKDR